MKLSFYPTDIAYAVKNSKPVVQIYGRTSEGKQVCILDDNFEPYFYARNIDIVQLEKLEQDDFKVVRVERVKKKLNEQDTELLKIFVNVPKAVPVLKDLVRSRGAECYEYDILYTRRYGIDKRLIPLLKTSVDCDEVRSELCVPCFQANKIECLGEDVLQPRILAVDIETYNPDNKMNAKKNPVLMIGLYGENFERVITWKKFETKEKYVEFVPTEEDALLRFLELVKEYAPDIITGYFSDGFDFPYLVERAKVCKVKLNLGLDNSPIEVLGRAVKEAKIVGIAHVDIFKFIRRVIGRSLKTDTYSLDSVSRELLGAQKYDVNMDLLSKVWDAGSKELEEYCKYNLQDCKLTYDLTKKVLPNLIEFVRIIGLFPYEINRLPFSTFVEWYLIKRASAKEEIILNKPRHSDESARISDRIQGAFVYEPTPGLYKNIVVFDYRSLYPSIIASHNISRGTLNCTCCADAQKIKTDRGVFRFCTKKKGLFSEVISELIVRRAEIKKELKVNKDPLLVARSEALKVLANSFYGYMGFAPARWYCIECAESTTALARQYIHMAIDTAQAEGFKVLYSDTDSVFLLLDQKTKDDAFELMKKINKQLPNLMELDFEGLYPAGIFVSLKAGEKGAKKKYALLDEKGVMKIKGFESVRRNWSAIAKEVQEKVLEIMLKESNPMRAKAYVRSVVDDLRKNKVDINKVIIKTALSKGTEAYSSIGPHVAAAQRLTARGTPVSSGSIIRYVVVKGKGRIRDKVRLPDEISQAEYDGEYYVQNQVLPGVERIFAVLGITIDDLTNTSKQSSLAGF